MGYYCLRGQVSILGGVNFFSLLHGAQTGSGTYLASYPMGTGSDFPGGKEE
jgi:hypothetical protein